MQPLLDVSGMSMNFGGLRALDNVNLTVVQDEIVALIGPNGAGKTTFFNCITGIYNPTEGEVMVTSPKGASHRLNGLKPNHVAEIGMARTFQNIRLFPHMTVLENVMVGRHCRMTSGIFGAVMRTPKTRREEQAVVDDSYHLLERVGLKHVVNELAMNLPYGEQRKLEIARALATEPFLLLLDEPAAGMNPRETAGLMELINRIRKEEELSILLIEHDMKLVMNLSDRIYVMEYGRVIASGTPLEIRDNPQVIKAYLGEDEDA
jgi:branched-chain amino acid transport system ATP-binding protein